ncbi:MAG: winged helix-turn-helix domain-containing protein [Candidatus Dormiibacterota bacterium]
MPKRHAQRHSPGDAPALRVEDPRSIRALAHPARLAIIDALASGEELTATQCAELTGLSPSATAYHLNFLERYGFAEAAPPRPDRRERPWRASGRPIQVDLDSSTPAGSLAAAAVVASYMDTTRAIAAEFTNGAHAEPKEWRDAVLHNADLWLTAEEFHTLARELEALLKPYRGRRRADDRPTGGRRVRVMNVVVPRPRRSARGARREA